MHRLLTILFCMCIFATLAGGIGGSYQPARIFLVGMAGVGFMASPSLRSNAQLVKQIFTLVIIVILCGVVSLAWTRDVLGGVGLILAVSVGACAIFAVGRADDSIDSVRLMIWSWFGVVAFSVVIAFYEITTGNHSQYSLGARVIGGNFGEFPFAAIFFGNYNDYSAWLCLAFPLTMAAFLEAKNFWARALVTMVNLAVVGIIFVNTSRTALIYVALVVGIYIIRFHRFRLYAFTASLLLAPVIFARYRGDILNLYDLAVYRFTIVSAVDESYNQRSGLILAGVNAVRESWGLGVGIGGFEEYINTNYPSFIPNPHNILLEIALNFGLLALVLFGMVIFLLLLAGLRRKDLPIGLRMALVLGSISVPVVGAVPSQAFGYVYWWVWLATMIAIANIPRHNHSMSLTPALHRQPA